MIRNYALLLEKKQFNKLNEAEDPTAKTDFSAGGSTDNLYYDPAKDPGKTQVQPQEQVKSPEQKPQDLTSVFNEVMKGGGDGAKALQTAIGSKLAGVTVSATGTEVDGVSFKGTDGKDYTAKIKATEVDEAGQKWLHVEVLSVTAGTGQGTPGAGTGALSGAVGKKLNDLTSYKEIAALQVLLNKLEKTTPALVPDGKFGPKTAAKLKLVVGKDVTQIDQDTLNALLEKAKAANIDLLKDKEIQDALSGKTAQPSAQNTGAVTKTGAVKGSLDEHTVLDIATKLKNQIVGLAWDETNKIIAILEPIKSQADMDAVTQMYEKIANESLIDALSGEYSVNPQELLKFLQSKGLTIRSGKTVYGNANNQPPTPAAPTQNPKPAAQPVPAKPVGNKG